MPVRLTEIPNLQGTRVNAPQVSTQAATAPARALGEVAQGIAQVGQAFEPVAERIQQMENARAESEARQKWTSGYGALKQALEKENDPAVHLPKTEEFLQEQKQTIDNPNLAPVVRDKLRLQFDDFATRAKLDATAGAANLSTRRATLALGNEFEEAKRTNNPGQWQRARETALETGILLPEQAQTMDREFLETTTFNSIARQIDEDPIGTLKELDGPDISQQLPEATTLSPENLDRLKRMAGEKANRARADIWDNVLNAALNEGEDHAILSRDELRALADDGTISPEQRASYLNAYHGEAPPAFDPHLYNEAFGAISTYDPAADPTGATLATLRGNLATLALPKEHVAELRDRLAERANPKNPTAHKLAGDFAKLNEEAFSAGRFGNWFSYTDHDNDPRTINRKVIDFPSYGRALAAKRRFTDAFDGWLRNQGDDLDPVKAQEVHDQLFERIVLDQDDPQAAPLVPGAPPLIDFGKDVDKLLGTPAPGAGKETSSATSAKPATFGGQPVRPPGVFYRNARPTIFGGKNDPADNGLSAFGGTTGEGGKEGVAIPLDVLKATFPGKDKAWFAANVRAVVKTEDGRQAVLPIADLGTAEWVWKRDGRPVLDLTPGAVKALGGRPVYKDGKLASVANLGSVSFALTTDNAGTEADLRGLTWSQAQDAWFRDKKPTDADQIASGLAALKSAWLEAQAQDIDPGTATNSGPWGDGTGGSVLPPIPTE